ncbi:hypothetical protein GCM10007981_10310 [Thermocladium modestius]|uniref:NurA domain-containing protein n=1 Tax=Thermocladium modestius TaxID=62609 RepID=A0A830GTX1_9CREN|nr:DNA double-strand break repair nuclease NurA [Thermocladium modestius]GGP20794.1 hypothetical protein GCM10007981_10310 [Thermocladium modestius]
MKEVFRLIDSLIKLRDNIGEYISQESIDVGDGGAEVDCGEGVNVELIDEGIHDQQGLAGADSQSTILRLENADVHVVTGALLGGVNALIPGLDGVKWLGIRLRFKPSNALLKDLEGLLDGIAYFKSELLERTFDGSYNEEAIREEIRTNVELRLASAFRGSGVLMMDGPIFSTPKVLWMKDNPYSDLYRMLAGRRVSAYDGLNIIGVVKRLSQSTYYSKCLGLNVDDATLVKNEVIKAWGSKASVKARFGPIKIIAAGYSKHCWYVAVKLGKDVNVVRVEALSPGLAERGAELVANSMTISGVPLPIHAADKMARRLNAGAVRLLAASPLGLTYEGLEELGRALKELGEAA